MRVVLVGAMLVFASVVAAQDLTLKGPTGTTATFSAQQIAALPHVHFTFAAHGESHAFEGPLLIDLLAKVGTPTGKDIGGSGLANAVIVTARDGYRVVFGLAELDAATRPNRIIVADKSDGAALREKDGPFKLVVEGDLRPARSVRMVQSIEVVNLGAAR